MATYSGYQRLIWERYKLIALLHNGCSLVYLVYHRKGSICHVVVFAYVILNTLFDEMLIDHLHLSCCLFQACSAGAYALNRGTPTQLGR